MDDRNVMTDELEKLENLKFIDKGTYRILGKGPLLLRWELNLGTSEYPFKDLVNCIATDSSDNRILALATEQGRVYVFDIRQNRFIKLVHSDHWIGSILVGKCQLLISNFGFRISAYALRSGRLTNRVQMSTKNREGFGSKGIIFTELKAGELLLFNSGYLIFKVYSLKLRKVLRTFSPFSLEHQQQRKCMIGNLGPVVFNFNFNKRHGILLSILKDDPHLYLWDFKKSKDVGKIKLFNPEDIPSSMGLFNCAMVSDESNCFIILQFLNLKVSNPKIVSLIVIVRIEESQTGKIPKVLLYDRLQHSQDIFMCQIVSHFRNFCWQELAKCEDGYVLVIGTNKGFTHIYFIDLVLKKLSHWASYKKIEGNLPSTDVQEISAIVSMKKNGSISATNDGRVIIIREKE